MNRTGWENVFIAEMLYLVYILFGFKVYFFDAILLRLIVELYVQNYLFIS